MQKNITHTILATFCSLFFVCSSLSAQTNDVLQQKDVTTDTLINALTPADKSTGTAEQCCARTRSFKVAKTNSQIAPMKTPTSSASASLMITFETQSSKLTGESKQILDKLAAAMLSEKLASFKFNIEGHADSRGNSEKNMKLSEERAEAVRKQLISQHHVDAARLIAIGKGDTEQLNPDNPAAPENRRVRIVTLTE
jgi:outer membrane protein OmpA-like peptidoglycan-associated protein